MAKRADRKRRRAGQSDVGDGVIDTNDSPQQTTVERAGAMPEAKPKHLSSPTQTDRSPSPKKPASTGQGKRERKSKSASSLTELVVIVAIAVGLAFLIQAYVVKPYKIPSGSMEPTLKIGQRVIVNRIATHFSEPKIGQITVFYPPEDARNGACGMAPRHQVTTGGAACDQPLSRRSSETFIKRIVAGPGDTIYIKEGHVYLKVPGHSTFVREKDSYIAPCGGIAECNFLTPITIPPGHWFMMGDNRGNSEDSRFWGPVPTSWIIGYAFVTYWPPDKIGGV